MLKTWIITITISVIIIVIFLKTTREKLTKLENAIKKEYSNIDINLKKRNDLIPNLIDTIKEKIKEEELLNNLIEERNNIVEASDEESIITSDHNLSLLLSETFTIFKKYPDLENIPNFLQLQNELQIVEETLLAVRKNYNQTINVYHQNYQSYPTSLVASFLGFKKYQYFKNLKED